MSKRRGDIVTVDDLIDAIGVDAARFFMVGRSHDSTLDLDLDLAVEQSSKNPVYYVQYAHARICSVLRNLAREQGDETAHRGPPAGDLRRSRRSVQPASAPSYWRWRAFPLVVGRRRGTARPAQAARLPG